MKKVLVAGGAGFIGLEFCKILNEHNLNYKIVDKLSPATDLLKLSSIKGTARLLEKDINKLTFRDVSDCDVIVNFTFSTEDEFIVNNISGTLHLLELAKKIPNFKKFIQISSDDVYGNLDNNNLSEVNEHGRLEPSTFLSTSKISSDLLVIAASKMYNLPFLITRLCTNFGYSAPQHSLIPSFLNSIKLNQPITIEGNGNTIREWMDVEDTTKVLFLLMMEQKGIFNVGSGIRVTDNYIADYIISVSKSNSKKIYKDSPTHIIGRQGINCEKLKSILGHKLPNFKHLNQFLYESLKSIG